MFKKGDYCKHFKGKDLIEKNIYQIIDVSVSYKDIDLNNIVYTGDKEFNLCNDLVIYKNIFQDNKIFCREYEELNYLLDLDKQKEYNQLHRVDLLNDEEINIIKSYEFIKNKKLYLEK